MLTGSVGMFKIGKQLFTACGPAAVRTIQESGGEVFLDLKYHDIPNTVAMATLEAARLGVRALQPARPRRLRDDGHDHGGARQGVHGRRAGQGAGGHHPHLVDRGDAARQSASIIPVAEMVVRLAQLAKKAGIDGVVASPQEIGLIREACGPDFLIVTPGVRPAFAAADDQKRIMTPAEAVASGADYLVIGRPISAAAEPVKAAELIIEEIRGSG